MQKEASTPTPTGQASARASISCPLEEGSTSLLSCFLYFPSHPTDSLVKSSCWKNEACVSKMSLNWEVSVPVFLLWYEYLDRLSDNNSLSQVPERKWWTKDT